MGQDISDRRFSAADFAEFKHRLQGETSLLGEYFAAGAFACTAAEGGFELEAWLIDQETLGPAPLIDALLARLDEPLVVAELAQFNLELNSRPEPLSGSGLDRLHGSLEQTLARCREAAAGLGAHVGSIGILPTVGPEDLVLARMTPRERYRALNEQLLRLRDGTPIQLAIAGQDEVQIEQRDVMLEAAATSFQIHLKIPVALSARFYNAAKILSAPMVALSANSPTLFGRRLWQETRIPLFEQAVAVGGGRLRERVGFGIRYAEDSVLDCFIANIERYEVLLPVLMDEPAAAFAHLRLHNGTIWRWNRPLIGFDANGTPHLRLEHRVVAAGPSAADNIADAAFFFGAVQALAAAALPPEQGIPFATARQNFYTAARHGLRSTVCWEGGKTVPLWQLIVEQLLPLADQGLASLGTDAATRARWLGIIEQRARTQHTGSHWQCAWLDHYGEDMAGLTAAWLTRQATGRPVHDWPLR